MANLGIILLHQLKFMWQHDTHAIAQFINECMDGIHWTHMVILAFRARHQISPRRLDVV